MEAKMQLREGLTLEEQKINSEVIERWREKWAYNRLENSTMNKTEYYEFIERLIPKEIFEKLRGPLPIKNPFEVSVE